MTLVIVYSGFVAIGLVLFDPNRVLEKLNTQLRTPISPLVLLLQQWVSETLQHPTSVDLQA